LPEEDRAKASDKMLGKFGEILTCGFYRYASGQTGRRTDALIAILRTSIGGRSSNIKASVGASLSDKNMENIWMVRTQLRTPLGA